MWKVVIILACAGAAIVFCELTPTNKCGPNQVFSNCTNGGCSARFCSQAGKPVPCVKLDPKNCKKGCVCTSGYLQAANGTCVPKNQCNEGCGSDPNSHPGCGINCGRTCATYKKKGIACILLCNEDGCDCNDGYVYDPNEEKCVLPKDCTPTCGKNEVYSGCTNGGCGHKSCSQLGTPDMCIDRVPETCIKGCLCAAGYLRADNGTCIPQDQCPIPGCGGDRNAEPGCGFNCGKKCSDYKIRNKALICPRIQCRPDKCDCKSGYVFDGNLKKCVLPEQCTPICGRNEQYDSCTNGGCGHRNCSQIGQPQLCIDRTLESCTKGCSCIEGYLRADNGTCIPQDQCPVLGCGGDPNAHSGCGVNCGKTCAPTICPKICKVGGCDCNDGFVFDANLKKCVVPKDCTPTCGLNEVFSSCTNGYCGHRNCSQLGGPILCVDPISGQCKKGCVCANGYLRADNGTCVPEKECPTSPGCGGDPNAHSGCGVNCGRTCTTYQSKEPIACPAICRLGGCDCNDGYVFDNDAGKCVLPKDCSNAPPTGDDQCPGQNEFYDTCISGCSSQSCDSIGKVIHCPIQPAVCREGCRCKPGFYRNADNVCVAESECPITCGLNEVFSSCTNGYCGHRNCSELGGPILCVDPVPGQCKKGCVCANGYLRADNGTCVLEKECPTSSGCRGDPNAHSGCGVNCGRTCTTYQSKEPIACILICNLDGCDCNDGYVFDDDVGKCVLPENCSNAPPTGDDQCPGQNEFYNTCISGCPNQSCESIGKVIECLVQPAVCREGCQCKPGFYRNADNVCVAESECPSSNQCTGPNEFFDTCISGCSNQSCDSIGKIINCPIQAAVCRTGCRCQSGFYRNESNVCVPESQCPAPTCPDGEIWSRCPTVPCEGDNCPKDRNSPQTCPVGIVCDAPRCTCGPLDKRDENGKCIKAYTCPPFKCDGPNEHYESCPAGCPGEKCSDYVNGSKCPRFRIGVVVPCRPACRCDEGYYRDSNNTCVIAEQCGPIVTTTNTPVSLETLATEAPTTQAITTTTDKPAVETTTASPTSSTDGVASGVANFNGKFLYNRIKGGEGKNIIASPFSVFTPLVQLAMYADGDSLKQLTSVLNVSTKEQIRSAFPALVASFSGQTSVNFSTAAKVYGDAKHPLSDAFIKDSSAIVKAEAENVDFTKNNEVAAAINAWVESQTNNRIHNLIQPSDLSALTRLVLVNAIYFKGDWRYSFNKNSTIKNANFYLSDGSTKNTSLMYQERQFNYGEVPELDCTVLQMFYKGNNFSMVVVLPNKNDGVLDLAEKLQDQENFDKVTESLSSQKVKVYLPPFTITTTTDLSEVLKQIGVTNIFNPENSGLSGLLKTPEDTYVSKAVQKAFIEVNEEGSEAAAANGIGVGAPRPGLPPPAPVVFRADRGFLFYLKLKSTVVFCGAVQQ